MDQMPPGDGAYPHYKSGGVGQNFVAFDVVSAAGAGFKFHVEIYGSPTASNHPQLSNNNLLHQNK